MPNRVKSTDIEGLSQVVEIKDAVEEESLALLGRFRDVRALRQALVQQEIVRLKTRYGEDHPRVAELTDALKRNSDILPGFEVELEVSKIKVPATAEKDALIHGRITDEKMTAREGLIAALTDKEGKSLGVEDIKADASGYFAFVLKPEIRKALEEKKKEIYLTVSDQAGRVLYRKPDPLKPEEGGEIRESIVLKTGRTAVETDKTKEPEVRKPREAKKRPGR